MQVKKRFGQVFLQDARYIERIVQAVAPSSGDTVIEIGPGAGAITPRLAEQAGRVIAVEIDRDLVPLLREKFKDKTNIEIVQADILETRIASLLSPGLRAKVAGNLPYNIASLIILNLLRERACIEEASVMVQREVGERLTAEPGTKAYSFLSVAVQTYSAPRRLFVLPPGAFRPAPKVDSAFLKLSFPDRERPLPEPAAYFALVSCAFSQRRKKVINVLSRHYPEDKVHAFFDDQKLPENSRAENLTVHDYTGLCRALAL